MNLLELYAKLSLDTGGYDDPLEDAEEKADKAGSKIGSALAAGAKVAVAAMTTAATAVSALTKVAVDDFSQYEQLIGGVKKLFGDDWGSVSANADRAFQTAGMSANKYMDTVTSFSASLISGLKGNTKEAAKIADVAIQDMSDNANTFGTNMDSIQAAYAGFAKNNFTMLDNLKLGYSGSQEGMVKLINESGILEKEIENLDGITFDQMVLAIHKVQENMNIAGTTSREAATTIEGSMNSAKAAWENLLTGLASGEKDVDTLINDLVVSVEAVGSNVIPRVVQTLESFGTAVDKLAPIIADKLPGVASQVVPALAKAALSLITALGNALLQNAPSLISYGINTAKSLVEGISGGLADGIPALLAQALPMLVEFSAGLRENSGELITAGLEMVLRLAEGIANSMPVLIENIPTIITNIAGIINDNAPKILMTGVGIIITLGEGLIKAIPTLISNIPKIIEAIISVWTAFNWVNLGKNVVKGIIKGIKALPGQAKSIMTNAVNAIKNAFSGGGIPGVVSTVFNAIKSNISSIISGAVSVVKNAVNILKGAFKFSWSLPHLKLPHISYSLIQVPVLGTIPDPRTLKVSWYKKAYDNSVMFTSPTVLPTLDGYKGFGDGNGGEIVLGKNKMLDMIQEAQAIGMSAVADILREIRDELRALRGSLYDTIVEALKTMGIEFDERELARLVRRYA